MRVFDFSVQRLDGCYAPCPRVYVEKVVGAAVKQGFHAVLQPPCIPIIRVSGFQGDDPRAGRLILRDGHLIVGQLELRRRVRLSLPPADQCPRLPYALRDELMLLMHFHERQPQQHREPGGARGAAQRALQSHRALCAALQTHVFRQEQSPAREHCAELFADAHAVRKGDGAREAVLAVDKHIELCQNIVPGRPGNGPEVNRRRVPRRVRALNFAGQTDEPIVSPNLEKALDEFWGQSPVQFRSPSRAK
ncbi:hypothetical protein EYF80_019356 [Liparis tanakae]|uniref:Uncharacterized protein n=1 Tax=Liparis tanakae TaxID=230148 RepID=A0A4Z2HXA8_9TELE|nr:hypothetical protein EYF80_019356 [Liparis tanakae]